MNWCPSGSRLIRTTTRRFSSTCQHYTTSRRRHLLACDRRCLTADKNGHVLSRFWQKKSMARGLATTTTTNTMTTRSKSSMAALIDDHDEDAMESDNTSLLSHPSQGHAAAVEATMTTTTTTKSHAEAWAINLGRNDDNVWLTGSRPDKWWTGVHPRDCSGTFFFVVITTMTTLDARVVEQRAPFLIFFGLGFLLLVS